MLISAASYHSTMEWYYSIMILWGNGARALGHHRIHDPRAPWYCSTMVPQLYHNASEVPQYFTYFAMYRPLYHDIGVPQCYIMLHFFTLMCTSLHLFSMNIAVACIGLHYCRQRTCLMSQETSLESEGHRRAAFPLPHPMIWPSSSCPSVVWSGGQGQRGPAALAHPHMRRCMCHTAAAMSHIQEICLALLWNACSSVVR